MKSSRNVLAKFVFYYLLLFLFFCFFFAFFIFFILPLLTTPPRKGNEIGLIVEELLWLCGDIMGELMGEQLTGHDIQHLTVASPLRFFPPLPLFPSSLGCFYGVQRLIQPQTTTTNYNHNHNHNHNHKPQTTNHNQQSQPPQEIHRPAFTPYDSPKISKYFPFPILSLFFFSFFFSSCPQPPFPSPLGRRNQKNNGFK